MGMSIDLSIRNLKVLLMREKSISNQDSLRKAIQTMERYQKIQSLFNQYEVIHMKELSLTSGFENALCEVMDSEV